MFTWNMKWSQDVICFYSTIKIDIYICLYIYINVCMYIHAIIPYYTYTIPCLMIFSTKKKQHPTICNTCFLAWTEAWGSIPVAKQQPWLDPWTRRWSSQSFKVIASTHTLLVSTENTRSVHKTQRAKDWNLQSWEVRWFFWGWNYFVFQFFLGWVVFNLLFVFLCFLSRSFFWGVKPHIYFQSFSAWKSTQT